MPGIGAESVPNHPQNTVVTTGAGVNAVQTIKVDATAGTYTISYGDITTPSIAFNATAAELKAKLEGIDGLLGNITVTGGVGNSGGTAPYVVTFINARGHTAVEPFTATASLTGGGAAVTITQTVVGAAVGTNAVIKGTGLADRTGETSFLEQTTPAAAHTANSGSKYE